MLSIRQAIIARLNLFKTKENTEQQNIRQEVITQMKRALADEITCTKLIKLK